jgi:hypothetical protein
MSTQTNEFKVNRSEIEEDDSDEESYFSERSSSCVDDEESDYNEEFSEDNY